MSQTRVTLHSGTGWERNQEVFEACLGRHQPPHATFLYLVITSWRKRQLKKRFLDAFPASFEVPIFTLAELVGWLLRFDPRPVTPIGEMEKHAILLKLLEESGDAERQAVSGERQALPPLASRFISHVKQQNIHDEEMLRLRYAKSEIEPGPMQRRLAALFGNYQQELRDRRLEDAEDRCTRLYESLLTGSLSLDLHLPKVGELVVEGGCPRPPLHLAMLRMLFRSFPRVWLSLDHAGEQDLSSLLEGLPVEHDCHAGRPEPSVTRLDPATREEEVIAVARRIRQLTRRSGPLDPESAAVICTRPGDYLPLLGEVFGERAIPFCLADGRTPPESQWLRLVRAYIGLVQGDFPAGELFDFLRREQRAARNFEASEIDRLESAARLLGVSSGRDNWMVKFPAKIQEAGPEGESSRLLRTVSQKRRDAGTPATGRPAPGGTGSCRSEGGGAEPDAEAPLIERFLDRLNQLTIDPTRPLPLLDWFSAVTDALPFSTATTAPIEGRVRSAVRESLFRLSEACRHEAVSFDRFCVLLELALDRLSLASGNPDRAVVVGTPEQLQQCRFGQVFWLGLCDGTFPRTPHREALWQAVGRRDLGLPGWNDHLIEEERLFALLTRSAGETVTLSRPRHQSSLTTQPSPFLEVFEPEPPSQSNEQLFGVDGGSIEEIEAAVQQGIAVETARVGGQRTPYQGWFDSPQALAMLRQRLADSRFEVKPAQLEEYVRCGFRFFVERVLKVRPAEPFRLDLSPREKGNLLHRIFYRFMDGLAPPGEGSNEERQTWLASSRRRMLKIVDEEISALKSTAGRSRVHVENLQRQLSQGLTEGGAGILCEFVDQQWDRLRRRSILALEPEAGPVPLGRLKLKKDRILPLVVKGRLDRLETGPRGLTVVDYKTGPDPRKRIFNGWGLQLPLYAFLAEAEYDVPVADAGFYQVRLPDRVRFYSIRAKSDGDPQSGFQRLRDYYQAKAIRAAQSLYEGNFPATLLGPSEAGCRTCRLSSVCRFDAAVMKKQRTLLPGLLGEALIERGHWIKKPKGSHGG